jgi:hypothetical protein
MVCPVCKDSGLTSRVYSKGIMATCLGFMPHYDEVGEKHSHNPNRHVEHFECSNGHTFERAYYIPCPSCGHVKAPDKIAAR